MIDVFAINRWIAKNSPRTTGADDPIFDEAMHAVASGRMTVEQAWQWMQSKRDPKNESQGEQRP